MNHIFRSELMAEKCGFVWLWLSFAELFKYMIRMWAVNDLYGLISGMCNNLIEIMFICVFVNILTDSREFLKMMRLFINKLLQKQ